MQFSEVQRAYPSIESGSQTLSGRVTKGKKLIVFEFHSNDGYYSLMCFIYFWEKYDRLVAKSSSYPSLNKAFFIGHIKTS